MPMVETGQVLVSMSGRTLSPVPKVSLGSDRKVLGTLKRIDQWLALEASQEPGEFTFKLLRSGLLTEGDRALCNLILFGSSD